MCRASAALLICDKEKDLTDNEKEEIRKKLELIDVSFDSFQITI